MKTVWRWIRKFWWALLLGAGALFGVLWAVLGPRDDPTDDSPKPPSFADKARNQVEKVRLEGEVEKARVRARTNQQQAELDRIEEKSEEDPREARRELSDFLRRSL